MRRDQIRARLAFEQAREAAGKDFKKSYRSWANSLGAFLMRDGLAATVAFLERDEAKKDKAASLLLKHLDDTAKKLAIPGLQGGERLGDKVRAMAAREYMLTSREMLRVALWMKRAVQASIPTETG